MFVCSLHAAIRFALGSDLLFDSRSALHFVPIISRPSAARTFGYGNASEHERREMGLSELGVS